MNLEEELKKAGLRKPEIVLYLYLLEKGISSAPELARGTGLLRANIYNVLQSLREKRLLERSMKGKRFCRD